MKKILLISGSPREKGNTMLILRECAKIIESEGLETEILSLANREIKACKACYTCEKIHRCIIKDDLDMFIKKIKEADGLIIGSPIYFRAARGDLLNLLQRIGMINFSNTPFLKGKVGGAIAVAKDGNHPLVIEEMMGFFKICEFKTPKSLYKDNIIGRNPGEALNDKEGLDKVFRFVKDVVKMIK